MEWGYKGVKMAYELSHASDSIFCGNDLIAIGAIKALTELVVREST